MKNTRPDVLALHMEIARAARDGERLRIREAQMPQLRALLVGSDKATKKLVYELARATRKGRGK